MDRIKIGYIKLYLWYVVDNSCMHFAILDDSFK